MKRFYLFLALVISASISLRAGITAYQFTSVKWASQVGSTKCDGKTDGWTSDKDGGAYDAGRLWADKTLHGAGVSVQTGQSEAGATSVKSFTNIRQITFNLCQNASNKGQGVIYVQIGDADPDSMVITNQSVTDSEINRDSVMRINPNKSGKIRFWVTCTKNAIHINTITIRAEEGGTDPFTQDSYQLVTNVTQLQDSDQIIFGAATNNLIMSYYGKSTSQNNIEAIKGYYDEDRQTVRENDAAVYTLWVMEDTITKKIYYVFVDEIRWGQEFLVANGGATKNRLATWYEYTSPAYGDDGIWDVQIAANGDATIMSMGTSKGKYMQLNAGNPSGPIYACYENMNYEPIRIYRRVAAIGDKPGISAPLCQMGTAILTDEAVTGSKTILINAHKLTKDISCSLKHGDVFTLDTSKVDRDGDYLTIRYTATMAGQYTDTLLLTSDTITAESIVMLDVEPMRSISEVVGLPDYTMVYLNPVVVTKKNGLNTFVRDSTGSMLIFGGSDPTTGKPYAQGLEQGHVLSNVQGRFKNYYGVPELSPTTAWSVAAKKVDVQPEEVTSVDSADVCRYVRIEEAVVDADSKWQDIEVTGEPFQTSVILNQSTTLDAIVMIDHDELQLWVVKQEYTPTGIEEVQNAECGMQNGKYLRNGQLYIRNNGVKYNINGQKCNK